MAKRLGILLQDICHLLRTSSMDLRVSYVLREGNRLAKLLVNFGRTSVFFREES